MTVPAPAAPAVIVSQPTPEEFARAATEIAARRVPDGPTSVQGPHIAPHGWAFGDFADHGWPPVFLGPDAFR